MLLIIESFCRFVQGKVILNKRVDTMINAITDTWIMCFGIPSLRFYADNGGEFVNVKIDKIKNVKIDKIRCNCKVWVNL